MKLSIGTTTITGIVEQPLYGLNSLLPMAGLMVGSHFAPPGFGRIERTPTGYRLGV